MFKSICHTDTKNPEKYVTMDDLQEYKVNNVLHRLYEYDVDPIFEGGILVYYNIYYEGHIVLNMFGVKSFPSYFYTKEETRDIKLNEVLDGKV